MSTAQQSAYSATFKLYCLECAELPMNIDVDMQAIDLGWKFESSESHFQLRSPAMRPSACGRAPRVNGTQGLPKVCRRAVARKFAVRVVGTIGAMLALDPQRSHVHHMRAMAGNAHLEAVVGHQRVQRIRSPRCS